MEGTSRLERAYAWSRANPSTFDALLAATAFTVLALLPGLATPQYLLFDAGLIAPLLWRRRRPVLATALIGLVGYLQVFALDAVRPADAAVPIAIYSVVAYGPRWAGRAAIGLALAGSGAAAWTFYRDELSLFAAFATTTVIAAWALGTMRRLRHREEERLVERARLLETERAQEARLAATAERARIAREMHDVVAHSLSVTISQADGGRYAARTDPQAAIAALETISVTGRQALADMRALLGVLRQDDDRPLAPQPDADTIPDLIEQARASGQDVGLEIRGRARKLPPGVALAAYRIVQESLTNVRKHAGPAGRSWVLLDWERDHLAIEVLDDGRGAGARLSDPTLPIRTGPPGGVAHPGQGVRGMRERATLHGGQLEAGPRPGGGFAVRARLPYEGAR
jgi:signal transduction histidine kinase